MATSIFSPFQSVTSLFSRKKKEETPQYFPTSWSSAQSGPASTPKQTAQVSMTPSWQSKPATKQTYFPNNWRQASTQTNQTTPANQRQRVTTQATPRTQPTTFPQTDMTGINPLVAKAREIAQRQAGFYSDQADKRVGQLDEQQGIRTKYADERVSKLNALKDAAIGRIGETIPLQEQATNEYKTQVEDQYGRQIKEQAQAQREEQQGIQDLFAGLNTMDSGAFQTQAMKSRERLTANQSATVRERTNELNAADRDLKSFKLEAQQQISNEVAKFDDLLLQIAENMEVGSAEYNAAVQQVYDQAQEAILGLESGLAERELAYEEKAQELQAELLKEQIKKGTDTAASSQAKQSIVDVANQMLKGDTNPITGALRLGGVIPGGKGQVMKGLYDQLVAMLSLENREKLKGSGAISDFEAGVLQRAASRLRPGMGDADFRAALQEIVTNMGGQPYNPPTNNSAPNSNNDPLGLR